MMSGRTTENLQNNKEISERRRSRVTTGIIELLEIYMQKRVKPKTYYSSLAMNIA
ncbi:hypothetical protein YC2023_059638 [Brassica napus]